MQASSGISLRYTALPANNRALSPVMFQCKINFKLYFFQTCSKGLDLFLKYYIILVFIAFHFIDCFLHQFELILPFNSLLLYTTSKLFKEYIYFFFNSMAVQSFSLVAINAHRVPFENPLYFNQWRHQQVTSLSGAQQGWCSRRTPELVKIKQK